MSAAITTQQLQTGPHYAIVDPTDLTPAEMRDINQRIKNSKTPQGKDANKRLHLFRQLLQETNWDRDNAILFNRELNRIIPAATDNEVTEKFAEYQAKYKANLKRWRAKEFPDTVTNPPLFSSSNNEPVVVELPLPKGFKTAKPLVYVVTPKKPSTSDSKSDTVSKNGSNGTSTAHAKSSAGASSSAANSLDGDYVLINRATTVSPSDQKRPGTPASHPKSAVSPTPSSAAASSPNKTTASPANKPFVKHNSATTATAKNAPLFSSSRVSFFQSLFE